MSDAVISVRHLRKTYRNLVAVDDVSLDVHAGETFGLLGPNGAGKSTTLGMLVGSTPPDSGEVNIAGATDPSRPEARKQIGIAPQALALYEDLTADENLRFYARLFGLTGARQRERVDWALTFAQLTERRSDLVRTYSGGMKRRLNLAIALIHDPTVILLDEPTVGIDPQSRNMIFSAIEDLKANGRTVIYTTHYMEEAQRLCDRVAIIDHGRILANDTVPQLIASHGGNASVSVTFDRRPETMPINGEWSDRTLTVSTAEPLGVVQQLERVGVEYRDLAIEQANLESVFLNLTGRGLRD